MRVEGGYLQPKMRDTASSESYDLRQDESHGLKELISLLTLVHDDESQIMVIDEPELHLHPQYQRFLLQEIREVSGHPDDEQSKAFFLITHSPSMIELRNVNDLTNVYSFRSRSQPPYSVDDFGEEDEFPIRRLLPRLNTRHKEILFSRNPILVEGYTDEQIYSIAIEKHEGIADDPESALIGVGGKGDLDAFFRFCQNLGLQPRFISDLDMLFRGNIRETVSDQSQVRELAQEAGLGSDISNAMGEAQRRLHSFVQSVEEIEPDEEGDDLLRELHELLLDTEDPSRKQYLMLRALKRNDDVFESLLDQDDMRFVHGRVDAVTDILSDCGYHVLDKGELEDYLREDESIRTLTQERKSALFKNARTELLDATHSSEVTDIIGGLVSILTAISPSSEANLIKYIEKPISDWMHDVQWTIREGQISSLADLQEHDNVGEDKFGRIFEIEELDIEESGFTCRIRLNESLDSEERSYEFSESDSPASINLPTDS